MTEPTDRLYDAINAIVRGDDGEIHENGAIFLEWLRGICHWGDSPLAEGHYTGDLIKHGAVMGKQEVYSQVLEALNIPPLAEKTHQINQHVDSSRNAFDTGSIMNYEDGG